MNVDRIHSEIISPALERANDEMPNFDLKDLKTDAPLYGVQGAMLDSLNLITFVFIVEEEFERVTGKKLKVSTQDVLNPDKPPFANLSSLALFLQAKIDA